MDLPSDLNGADQETGRLLRLARELRQAATDANRLDLITRIDEVIALIQAGERTGKADDGVADPVIRFLNGLGL